MLRGSNVIRVLASVGVLALCSCGSSTTAGGPPQVVSFSASPTQVVRGGATILSWNVRGASAVEVRRIAGGAESVLLGPAGAFSGVMADAVETLTTYRLIARSVGGTDVREVQVDVAPAGGPVGILAFNVYPSVIGPGESAHIAWSTTPNAANVTIDNRIDTMNWQSGVLEIRPVISTVYTLTASDAPDPPGVSQTVTRSAAVTVQGTAGPAPTIGSFTIMPAIVGPGDPVVLAWTTANATTIAIDPIEPTPQTSPTGALTAYPTATTVYTLTAAGPGGSVSASQTVTVPVPAIPPVIFSFGARPATIASGSATTLRWEAGNADSVTIDNGVLPTSPEAIGATLVAPAASTTYRLTATNPAGTATAQATITVVSGGDVIVSEILRDPIGLPDGQGEWIELYNTSAQAIDLTGWLLSDEVGDNHTIRPGVPLTIPAGGFVVLGPNADFATNGGVAIDYQVAGFYLGNQADEVALLFGGIVMDRVVYDATWPSSEGHAMSLSAGAFNATDNNLVTNWCASALAYGALGNFGTPHAINPTCP